MASQTGELPTARVEKLDNACHDSALDFAQDIARNLQIASDSGESIRGDTGKQGDSGVAGKDGTDGADGTDGITPTLTVINHDLTAGDQFVDGLIPIDKQPFLEIYWRDETALPAVAIPVPFLRKDTTNNFIDVKFIAAVVGDFWTLQINWFA